MVTSGSDDDASVATQLGRPQSQQPVKKKRPVIRHETRSGDDDDDVILSRPAVKKDVNPSSKRPAEQCSGPIAKKKPAELSSEGARPPTTEPQKLGQLHEGRPTALAPPQPRPAAPGAEAESVAITRRAQRPSPSPPPRPPRRPIAEESSATDTDDDVPLIKRNKLVLEPYTESDDNRPLADAYRPPTVSPVRDLPTPEVEIEGGSVMGSPPGAFTRPSPPLPDPASRSDSPSTASASSASPRDVGLTFVNLADEKLRIEFRQCELYRKLPSKTGASIADQIKTYWRIGGWDNREENEVNFEQAMRDKVAYIAVSSSSDGIKSGVPGAATKARELRSDVLALQLLLASIPGVKLIEQVHTSVDVVFVHARDRDEVGKVGGKLSSIEPLRSGVSLCFLFGEAEVVPKADDPRPSVTSSIKKKWFRSLWTRSESGS